MAFQFRSANAGATLAAGAALWLACFGCAGTDDMPTTGGGGRGGTAGGRDAGAPIAGAGGNVVDAAVDRVIGGNALGDAACATATQRAQVVPLDLYIMLDSSGSMSGLTATNQTKWDAVRAALITFLGDARSNGLGVGLQYFPLLRPGVPGECETNGQCAGFGPCSLLRTCSNVSTVTPCETNAQCTGAGSTCVRLGVCGLTGELCSPAGPGFACSLAQYDTCDPIPGYCDGRDMCEAAAYATPAIPVATLPGAANALTNSLNQHQIDGLTPTAGALAGAIQHAQAQARANPTHKLAVLLATDGLPSVCEPTDINGVAALASVGFAATPAIATYVIGVFAPDEEVEARANLNAIAAAGGTQQAFIINTNQNVTQMFVAALNQVRTSALACQYTLPAVTGDGGQPDYFSVNVQFTAGSGQVTTIGNVKDRASCSATRGGWYYDVDPSTGATPRTISACDLTCNQLKADPSGQVDILLGCKTIFVVD